MKNDFIDDEVYLGRQPILNQKSEIVGYEILYRNNSIFNYYEGNLGDFESTIKVLSIALNNIGIEKLLDKKIGFLNVSEDLLNHNIMENIPKERFYMEILETADTSDNLLKKVDEFISKGYSFVLDDFIFNSENLEKYKELFPRICYLKADLQENSLENMKNIIQKLQNYDIKFIAEKVETYDDFEALKDMGYEYFQGYYFARPTILTTKKIDPSKLEIINILGMIYNGSDTQKIIKRLEKYPLICINLLKFLNSAYFSFKQEIKSIKQAITLLGLRNLKNWLILLLYTNDGKDPYSNPLFVMIKNRSDFMLKILSYMKDFDEETSEMVYLTGLLSKLHLIFNTTLEESLKELHISKSICDALLERKGIAGDLLNLAEANENNDFEEIKSILDKLSLQIKHLTNANLKSYLLSTDLK